MREESTGRQAQVDRLRGYLLSGRSITPLDAWRELGIYRLSARVFELRAAGEPVVGEFVKRTNQFGEPCRVMQYAMEAR